MKAILIAAVLIVIAQPIYAQSAGYDINKAVISWTWTQGAPPNDGLPTAFIMKCGPTSKNYTKLTTIADPAARSVSLRSVIGGSGNWFCAVVPTNQLGDGPLSSEISFFGGAPVSGASSLTIQ
jgi:hypothetical protein